jgi:DNA topoisomerase VI subunit A
MKLKSFAQQNKWSLNWKGYLKNVWKSLSAISDKGLISRIYKELKKLKSPKISLTQRRNSQMNWIVFSKEEIQMTRKYKKKCSTFLDIQKMKIKATLRFHLTPVRTTTIKNTNKNKCWQGCAEKEPLYTAGGNVNV